ncbi:ergothioneine biosynthesis protein EgtB [Allopontixanthobacter sp.]|uniref:ergothioneine biosynthesis protein EgtB n=1 Tax=Allopontixanthobacter sp. TaxID=2906452 RepID=UPI002ABB802B|nr:ergothioneine biosynthesis protein EgtB [Allopontixanthobacter sp.]MDZ4307907.1 ergothioneine biosynthesis protein EgtB [Allopontixanthobacter sp.]
MPEAAVSNTGSGTPSEQAELSQRFHETRALTRNLIAPLSEADAVLQSMEDASPAKWHLAHTNWFFETFLLRDHVSGYRLFDEDWPFLFNSYYEAEGERIARFSRGMLSRPAVDRILAWRAHVDEGMTALLDNPDLAPLIRLGIAHEQQHQELLLTDIKHALFQNPLGPAMFEAAAAKCAVPVHLEWHEHPGGIAMIGHDPAAGGPAAGGDFAFDNEGPRHRVLLEPFALANRLVTNREWDEFIEDGGYRKAALWLSDGWAWVQAEGVTAPLYWRGADHFTHAGWQPREPDAPVTHISYYEADAFATWAGARLPTEFEWEVATQGSDPAGGNQLDSAEAPLPGGGRELFGDCWQFTRSAYLPYPRFQPAAGAVGEYNGKFMSGQFVLKGASCATARGHSRATYRNFFYPHQRWQFTGLRLAKDIE